MGEVWSSIVIVRISVTIFLDIAPPQHEPGGYPPRWVPAVLVLVIFELHHHLRLLLLLLLLLLFVCCSLGVFTTTAL